MVQMGINCDEWFKILIYITKQKKSKFSKEIKQMSSKLKLDLYFFLQNTSIHLLHKYINDQRENTPTSSWKRIFVIKLQVLNNWN